MTTYEEIKGAHERAEASKAQAAGGGRQETIADIVAEMREIRCQLDITKPVTIPCDALAYFADRIEAAAGGGQRETIADIVREMRNTKCKCQLDDTKPVSTVCDALAYNFPDRIETAAKREIDDAERRGGHTAMSAVTEVIEAVKPELAPGNAAAMREALEAIHRIVVARGDDIADRIDRLCADALAAHPRNCDRFATAEEAEAYVKGRLKIRLDGKRYKIDGQEVKSMTEWLFAPAKESEAAE